MWTGKTDQTGWMPRLICVFTGRTLILLVLSCRCSNVLHIMLEIKIKHAVNSSMKCDSLCAFVQINIA